MPSAAASAYPGSTLRFVVAGIAWAVVAPVFLLVRMRMFDGIGGDSTFDPVPTLLLALVAAHLLIWVLTWGAIRLAFRRSQRTLSAMSTRAMALGVAFSVPLIFWTVASVWSAGHSPGLLNVTFKSWLGMLCGAVVANWIFFAPQASLERQGSLGKPWRMWLAFPLAPFLGCAMASVAFAVALDQKFSWYSIRVSTILAYFMAIAATAFLALPIFLVLRRWRPVRVWHCLIAGSAIGFMLGSSVGAAYGAMSSLIFWMIGLWRNGRVPVAPGHST
jgi:hypothetical protein